MGLTKIKEYSSYKESAEYILSQTTMRPEIGIVLGSCLGPFADRIEEKIEIDYKDIPGFLETTVEFHAGKMIIGKVNGIEVICMSGRFHYYEGHDFEDLDFPMRVFKLVGVEKVILTNAAGAINKDYKTGKLMLIKDHIKLMGPSPLRGPNLEEFGDRFFDMSDAYNKELRQVALKLADDMGIEIYEGTYFFAPGPQFETPAEINAMRILGADAVGMSTVVETIVAVHCGMKVLGISLLSNMAAGLTDESLTIEEVDETADSSALMFGDFISKLIEEI